MLADQKRRRLCVNLSRQAHFRGHRPPRPVLGRHRHRDSARFRPQCCRQQRRWQRRQRQVRRRRQVGRFGERRQQQRDQADDQDAEQVLLLLILLERISLFVVVIKVEVLVVLLTLPIQGPNSIENLYSLRFHFDFLCLNYRYLNLILRSVGNLKP